MIDYKSVFPSHSVKKVFQEEKVDRTDDMVIDAIQSILVSQCITLLLKPAILSCVNSGRKYIQERDIDISVTVCPFPAKDKPKDAGSLFNMAAFERMVLSHMKFIFDYISRMGIDIDKTIKLSTENVVYLQRNIEKLIRGFVHEMKKNGSVLTYNVFMMTMVDLTGDESIASLNHTFTPV
jgi:histone H3/H4